MAKLLKSAGMVAAFLFATTAHAQSSGSPPADDVKKLLAQALDAANQARDSEAKVQSLRTILGLEVRVGNTAVARRQSDALDKADNSTRFVVCEVAVALARKGDTHGGFATIKSDDPDEFGFCYMDIATAQGQEGDVSGTVETASHEKKPADRETIFGIAAAAAATAGKTDAADKLLDLALEAARNVPDAAERIYSLCMAAMAMDDAHRPEMVLTFLPEMQLALASVKESDSRDLPLSQIAHVQEIADKFADAEQTIKGIKGDTWPDFSRWQLIMAFTGKGDLLEASRIAQTLQGESKKADVANLLAMARAKQGDIAGALGMVDAGSSEYDRERANWTYAHIVIEQGKQGKNSEANQTARLITNDKVRAGTLIVMGSSAPLPDKDHVASTIFSEARAAALNIKELYFRAVALSHLAGVLATRGEFTAARDAADAIPSNAEDEDMLGDLEKHKGHALENIAYWQCKMGNCKDALEWVVRENAPILRSYAIAGTVEAMLGLKPPSDHYIEENYGW